MVIAKKQKRLGALLLLLAGGLSAPACNLVLGIGKASVDPSLESGCTAYCDLMAQSCTGTNAEYISDAVCNAMCTNFDMGKTGDTSGDTLGCRMTYAQKAASDPVTYCQQAGPVATGCIDPCSAFCTLDDDLCTPAGLFPYDAGPPSCETACAQYTYLRTVDAGDAGDTDLTGGNTLNCRIYHLESAYDPTNSTNVHTHCPHTGVVSATCF